MKNVEATVMFALGKAEALYSSSLRTLNLFVIFPLGRRFVYHYGSLIKRNLDSVDRDIFWSFIRLRKNIIELHFFFFLRRGKNP